jgi:drug/metabolite transporter (DMT)-like permease
VSDQLLAAVVALGAASLYVSGLALQQLGNRRAVAAGRASAFAVVGQPIWWLGLSVTGMGFLVHGFSLHLGSLTVVQPVQVAQIAIAVVLDARIQKTRVARRDWQGAGLVIAGLVVFMLVAAPTAGADFAGDGSWAWIAVAFVVGGSALALGAWRFPAARAVLLGTLAGVVWGVQGALLKETAELFERGLTEAFTSWPIYATAVLGFVGLAAQNLAVRAGRLATAASLITVVNPIVASIIGIAAFGEALNTDPGDLAGATLAALAVIAGVALLSRRRDPLVP